jgi:hypothetical protein
MPEAATANNGKAVILSPDSRLRRCRQNGFALYRHHVQVEPPPKRATLKYEK